jgi:hypothetical protein
MRSAGSHGIVDVLLIDNRGKVYLCQVKNYKMTKTEYSAAEQKLRLLKTSIGNYRNISYWIIQRIDGKDEWSEIN